MAVIGGLFQDLRFGARMLARQPAFTASAVLALALGIGASTAIFSLLDTVVLRPLPYREPDRLVMLWETNRERSIEHEPISPVNFMDYRGLSQVFEDGAAWWKPVVNLTEPDRDPIRVKTIEVSSNFFTVLGVAPEIGSGFPASPMFVQKLEAVISDRLWRTRFGADPSIVGSSIRLSGSMFTVLGVMPPGFSLPEDTDVWQRLSWDLSQHSRGAHFMNAVLRLRPGITIDAANRELAALTDRLGREFPTTNRGWGARTTPLQHEVIGYFGPALLAVFGAAALLLVIACFNVANLLLARATLRGPEVAVRTAIGAGRARLFRQFFTESVLLAAVGTLVGILAAIAAVRIVGAGSPIAIPRLDHAGLDLRALAFAVAATGVTAALFGVAPALMLARVDVGSALRARGVTRGRHALGLLVIGEVALAIVLLSGAGLLVRTVRNLLNEHPGFDATHVVTANLELPYTYSEWPRVSRFYTDLAAAVAQAPGIEAVGSAAFLPLSSGWRIPFAIEGQPPPARGQEPIAQHHVVDDGYFATLRMPIVEGRAFDARDTAERSGVLVVNRAMARRYWPDGHAIGQRISYRAPLQIGPLGRTMTKEPRFEIVGVVADVKNVSLQAPAEPAMFFSVRQFAYRNMNLVVRGAASASTIDSIVRAAVRRADPDLPLSPMTPMERVVRASVDLPRALMALLTAFAVLALMLAGFGLYGILAYAVGQRRRELGVRLALGARPAQLQTMVIAQGLRLVAIGCVAGIAGAYAAGRAMSGLLYGIAPADPVTIGGVVMLLIAVGVVASAIPARRAAAIDPLEGLRAE